MKLVSWIRKNERKGIAFLIFSSFLLAFLIARSFVYLTNQEIHLVIDGYTIHHIIIGIFLIILGGGEGLIFKKYEWISAIFYGFGLGLVADEFGFIISWGNYWNRISYDLILIIILIFLNIIFFDDFWKNFRRKFLKKKRSLGSGRGSQRKTR